MVRYVKKNIRQKIENKRRTLELLEEYEDIVDMPSELWELVENDADCRKVFLNWNATVYNKRNILR